MAIQLQDRIYTACTTIGKADIEIGAPKSGYRGWENINDGNTVYYCITDGDQWEVGYGVKTDTVIVRNLLSSNTGSLLSLDGNSSVFCTYPSEKAVYLDGDDNVHFPSSDITANAFVGKGSDITEIDADKNNLAPEAPNDGSTYARKDKEWVNIGGSAGIPDAPEDGLQYGRQDSEWTKIAVPKDVYTKAETDILLDNKANKSDTYTKSETYSSVEVDGELFKKADKATTYTKSEVDSSQSAQNSNISANTTAIGTLSGQVANNSEDIATLQEGIFFSSSYTTDYPSNPNRDPGTGNIYLQNLSAFTYSYADANQVFISKTDEQGNVRQFTAVKTDDILVLNQVESPNYGRYKVSSVNDLGDYVNVILEFQVGEGTVLEGDTLALQAFPASAGGSGGGIPEAPIDGKQYGRQDATWTEVTGGETTDILPVLLSGRIGSTGDVASGTGFTTTFTAPNIYTVTFDKALPDSNYSVTAEINSSASRTTTVKSRTVNSVEILAWAGNTASAANIDFTVTGTETISVGGSGGGGEAQPPVIVKAQISEQIDLAIADTKLIFGDVEEDTLGDFDAVNGRYTASEKGWYRVTSRVRRQGTGTCAIAIYKNNVQVSYGDYSGIDGVNPIAEVNDIVQLNVNDYIEIFSSGSIATRTLGNTNLSITKINGSSGSSSGGGTTDILPVLYSGSVVADGTIDKGTGFTVTKTDTGRYTVVLDKPVADKSSVGASVNFRNSIIQTKVNSSTEVEFLTFNLDNAYADVSFDFTVTGTETISVGGGTSPLAMKVYVKDDITVPHDVTTVIDLTGVEFDDDNTYSDGKFQPKVAGYYQVNAQVNANSGGPMTIVRLFDKDDNTIANGSYDSLDGTENFAKLSNVSTIVYLNGVDDCIKLAVRIKGTTTGPHGVTKGVEFTSMSAHLITGQSTGGGSGGKTVAFRGELSADQLIPRITFEKLNLATASIDTDNSLVGSAFKPSVAGYYQVNASVGDDTNPEKSTSVISAIYKNGDMVSRGNQAYSPDTGCYSSVVSDVIYLNGTTDYLELYGYSVTTATNAKITKLSNRTFLSAVLVSGGSASGGDTTPLLYEEVYPDNLDGVVSVSYTPLTGKLTADVVAGKKYLITGGTNAVAPNLTGVNVFAYWKIVTALNGGSVENTLCNMITASQSSSGGTGSYNPMERSFTYTAPESGTLELTAYCKMAGTGASCSFQNNVIRIQEVAETTGGSGGDSYWTESGNDLFYKSPNFDSGLYLNSQENNNMNIVGYNGTDACDLWIRSAGAPNSGLGIKSDGSVQVKGAGNTDVRITAPSGQYATYQVDNADQKYAMQIRPDQANAFVIRNETASQNTMSIATNGTVKFGTNMTIGNTGVISAQGINDTTTNAVAPNVCVDGLGVLRKSTVATYSVEEVDKRLAIKDKLIEKLSARLDELEKKVK